MLVLTYAQNISKNNKFAFKGAKNRVVRRTFWLINVVPTWKKFEKRCHKHIFNHNTDSNANLSPSVSLSSQQTQTAL
jgi:hypothetical protein